MIYKICGKIDDIESGFVVLNVGGIYYKIFTQEIVEFNLNEDLILHTHYSIKENIRELFGFLSKEDRDFFVYLTSINGLGEKTIMNFINKRPLSEIATILYNDDIESMCKLKGIGRKTAEKILTEFKHSIKKSDITGIRKNTENTDVINKSAECLSSLGINIKDGLVLAKKHYEIGMNVSDLIKVIIKNK
jgi:Holliday junction DNA helicase RuvA